MNFVEYGKAVAREIWSLCAKIPQALTWFSTEYPYLCHLLFMLFLGYLALVCIVAACGLVAVIGTVVRVIIRKIDRKCASRGNNKKED